MKVKDIKETYTIDSKCQVCGSNVKVDQTGNGDICQTCGWIQSSIHEEFPDRVICPNLLPLNKAKSLYKEGKPFIPDFDDFICGYNFYGEMEFTYNGKRYGLMGIESVGVELFEIDTDNCQTFKNIDEFKSNAKVGDKLIKDIWNEVTNAFWLQ